MSTEVEDYDIQEKRPLIIAPATGLFTEFSIDAVDDDIVETLIENFFVEIAYVASGDGSVNSFVTIGEDSRAEFEITDDDSKK